MDIMATAMEARTTVTLLAMRPVIARLKNEVAPRLRLTMSLKVRLQMWALAMVGNNGAL